MNNQTENLTYSQAMQCLLDGDATYIACDDAHVKKSQLMLNLTTLELICIGSFNEEEYTSHNWFLGFGVAI